MKGDSSSLSRAHKFGPQYRNDIPKLLELWNNNRTLKKPYFWFTPVKQIIENDYILSANAYNPNIGGEEKEYRKPKEILKEIEKGKQELDERLQKIKRLI